MEFLFFSFLVGALTILAPCVLPVLPGIIGGSLVDRDRLRPFIVTGSFALSIVVFTLLLKSTTAFISIPAEVWKTISGGIILVFGLFTLFPHATYALILATVLPQSFALGVINLFAYALGLATGLLLDAFFGQKAVSKMKWAADPNGTFKKILGIMLVFVGIAILFSLDKKAETFLLEHNYFDVGAAERKIVR